MDNKLGDIEKEIPDKVGKINCLQCNHLVDETMKFCISCGADLSSSKMEIQNQKENQKDAMRCVVCNAKLNKNAKFCVGCGTKIDISPDKKENIKNEGIETSSNGIVLSTESSLNQKVENQTEVDDGIVVQKIPNVISAETQVLLDKYGLKGEEEAYHRPYKLSYWCQADGKFFVFDEGIVFVAYEKEIEVGSLSLYYSDMMNVTFLMERHSSKNTVNVITKNGKICNIYVNNALKYAKFIKEMMAVAKERDCTATGLCIIPIKKGQPIDETKVRIVTAIPIILIAASLIGVGFYILPVYFLAIYVSFEFCTQDRYLLKKYGFDTDKMYGTAWIPPLYLYKRSQIVNEKSMDLILWCVFIVLHFICL